ncbi:unnamed protein product, partial [Prorocentrum cordatum]
RPFWPNACGRPCGRPGRPWRRRPGSARQEMGDLRAALAEERERLNTILDEVDEALGRLEPASHKEALRCIEPGSPKEQTGAKPAGAPPHEREGGEQPSAPPMGALPPGMLRASVCPTSKDSPGVRFQPASQAPSMAWQSGSSGKDRATARSDGAGSLGAVVAPSPPPVQMTPLMPVDIPKKDESMPRLSGIVRSRQTDSNSCSGSQPGGISDGVRRTREFEKRGSIRKAKQIFANADQMKEQVQQAILQPDYDVRELYKTEGCFQAVARSSIFDICGLTLIMLNAVWLGIETDLNEKALLVDADPPFIIVENFFCTCFCAELLIKFMAFSRKTDVLKDSWFVFDSVLVCFMAAETWLLSILVWVTAGSLTANSSSTSVLRVVRLFRMTRAARVARVLKAVPELMVIGHGIVIVARTVVVIFCLCSLGHLHLRDRLHPARQGHRAREEALPRHADHHGHAAARRHPPRHRPDHAGDGDGAFLLRGVLLHLRADGVRDDHESSGVLVEVVAVVASVEKEKNQVASVKRVLQKWAPEADMDGDNLFGVSEFKRMLNHAGCAKDLNDVGVDAVALIDHADFVYRNKTELTFAELLAVVLGLRGRNDPKVQDLVQLRKFLHVEMLRIEMSLEIGGGLSGGVSEDLF